MTFARRRVLATSASALALLFLLLLVVPYLFRDRIAARVQAEISRSVSADVSWSGVGLSLVRNFPNATLRLDELRIVGRDRFAGDTLAHVPRFRLVVGLPSVLRSARGTGPLVIRSIEIDAPAVQLRVLEDGAANWDLLAAAEPDAAATASPMTLELRRFTLRRGALTMENLQTGLVAAVIGLEQTLSGDFGAARYRVTSGTAAESVSVRFAGVPYLNQVRLGIDAAFDVDTDAGRVAVSDGEVRLNELLLELAGSVGMAPDSMALDLAFSAPGAGFQEILSLLPMLYAQPGFSELRTSGTVALSGAVRGGYGATAFPAFELLASVRDGRFQYPDLPLPARDVFLDVALTNPGGSADSTQVRVDRFHVVIGSDPIEGAFAMRTPVSDPSIDLRVRGRLDLAELNRTLRFEGAEELAGSVAADASIRARRSDVDNEQYDRIGAEGTISAARVVMRTENLPHAVQLEEGLLRLSPRRAELETFRGTIGSSDVALTGGVDNLLGFLLRDEELRGSARLASTRFDLNEWRSDDELQAVIVPRNIDFAIEADVRQLVFGDLDLRNARGALHVRDQRATLENFRMELFGGALAVTGFYETTTPARPTFGVALALSDIDVAQAAVGIGTMGALAPAARYARGRMSTEVQLAGAVGEGMAPIHDVLAGRGTFQTAGLSLHGLPALDELSGLLNTEQLRNPGLADLRSSFQIRDGRLHISPVDVGIGQFTATIGGSHGLDESMNYILGLHLPRALLGAETNRAVGRLASQAGRIGFDWEAADVVTLPVLIGGTVSRPTVQLDFASATSSALRDAGTVLRGELERRFDGVQQRADSAADEARRRAEAEAARLIEEAQRQADRLREEAGVIAENLRREGYARADALVAQAGNPAARIAARAGADRLRREADAGAERVLREAEVRADALVADARRRGEAPVVQM